MSKCKVYMVSSPVAITKKATGADPVADFILQDNQNGTVTVYGLSAALNPVDISGVATITAVPADPTILTVTVSGMTYNEKATGKLTTPGTPCNVVVTATWNDGTVGPFSFTDPVDVVAGPAGGIVIQHQPPISN